MPSSKTGSPSRLSTAEYGHQQEIEIATGTSLTFKAEVTTGTNYCDADMAFLYVDGRRFYNYTATGAKETAMTGKDGLLTMTFDKDGVQLKQVFTLSMVKVSGPSADQWKISEIHGGS